MDFRRILDQAVREIKREVNLKVLKVPEIEQKVLDATSDEPWGPHGSDLAEIARGTRKFSDCQLIMHALWSRLSETDENWRHIYKALSVIEYLISNGSERALNEIIDHSIQISSLAGFEYVEPNGKDVGINVRKKVETILALLDDREKISSARDKAAANREKYFGLSSTGITYKSNSASIGGSDSRYNDNYGGMSTFRDNPKFKVVYKHKDQYVEGTGANYGSKSVADRKDGVSHPGRSKSFVSSNTSKISSKPHFSSSSKPVGTGTSLDDDLDDFDPRASSSVESTTASSTKVDPFADSLLIDWSDTPASIPAETTSGRGSTADIDLFSNNNAAFSSSAGAQVVSQPEEKLDLFADQPVESSSSVDLFNIPDSNSTTMTTPPKLLQSPNGPKDADPFAKTVSANIEEPDSFGDFTAHPDAGQPDNSKSLRNQGRTDEASVQATSDEPQKRATLEIKSGIWADSLSRGLIDLNITAPKKVNLADIGIIGDLEDVSDDKGKGHLAPGCSMGGNTATSRSSLDWPGYTASGATGSLHQQPMYFDAFK